MMGKPEYPMQDGCTCILFSILDLSQVSWKWKLVRMYDVWMKDGWCVWHWSVRTKWIIIATLKHSSNTGSGWGDAVNKLIPVLPQRIFHLVYDILDHLNLFWPNLHRSRKQSWSVVVNITNCPCYCSSNTSDPQLEPK